MRPKVLLMGGFGNQLFQIAFALERYKTGEIEIESSFGAPRTNVNGRAEVWSYQLPSRLVEINSKKNRFVSKFLNLVLVQSISKGTYLRKIVPLWLIRKITEFVTLLNFKKFYRIVICDDVGFGSLSRKKPLKNDFVIGYFQSAKWFSSETLSILREITPVVEIEEISHLVRASSLSRPIIVHVRLGDYEQESGIGLLPFDYYLNGLNELIERFPESEIWLFSNDLQKAKSMFSRWQGKSIQYIEDNWNSTAATFEAMRLGHGYLIANSTFSYWSALLSKSSDPFVIAPSPWFLHSKEPREILPPDWKVINSI